MSLVIRGGQVVTPTGVRAADVLVENGTITTVGTVDRSLAARAEVVDARGCYVLPGGVDPHCHLVPDLAAASRAAALGGTTTALTFTLPEGDEPPAAAVRRARDLLAQGVSRIDIGLHGMCYRPDALRPADVAELAELGVDAIKVFLAYPELGIMASGGGLFRTMSAAATVGLPVQVHCEDGELIEALVERAAAQGLGGPEAFAEVRPPAVEQVAVQRALAVAGLTGARPYITHLSSADAVAHVRAARHAGQPVATEACLHHVLLDASVYRGERAGAFLVAPPLRTAEHVAAVRAALADGTIDGVGSDHSQARTPVDDRIGRDGSAGPGSDDSTGGGGTADDTESYGIAGIGARMPLLLSWGTAAGLPIERLAHLLATGPAQAFGHAPRKGRLAVGSDGDLVVWDPDEEWTVEADSFPDGTGTSPYAGCRVRGRIRFVALRGLPLVRDAHAVEPPPTGQLVVPHGGKGNGRD